MFRLNLLLLLAVVLCAMAVVTSQHHARKLFQALEAEQDKARQLDIEYGQLQIEMSTWATHPRLEKIARERLRMVMPAPVVAKGCADGCASPVAARPSLHRKSVAAACSAGLAFACGGAFADGGLHGADPAGFLPASDQ